MTVLNAGNMKRDTPERQRKRGREEKSRKAAYVASKVRHALQFEGGG